MAAQVKCPVCEAPTSELWRESGTQESGLCKICNQVRMEMRETVSYRLASATNLVERHFARKMARDFFDGTIVE